MDAVIYSLADQALQKAKSEFDEWERLSATLPEPLSAHTAVPISGDRILIFGGGGRRAPLLYDHATQTFTALANDSYSRNYVMAAPLSEDRVLVAGGIVPSTSTPSVLNVARIYDAKTNTWSNAAPMTTRRYAAFCAPLSNDRVFIAGGAQYNSETNETITLKTSELYDIASNTWTAKADQPGTARAWGACAPLSGDRVFTAGGGRGPGAGYETTSAYIYSLTTNIWTSVAPLDPGIGRTSCVGAPLSGDRVIVIGGCFDAEFSNEWGHRGEVVYSSTENRWYIRNRAPFSSYFDNSLKGTAVAPLSGDRVIAFGGWVGDGYAGSAITDKVCLYHDKNPVLISLIETVKAIAAIR